LSNGPNQRPGSIASDIAEHHAVTGRRITEAPVELHRTVGLVELAAGA
jgi:hypothetical protein